MSERHDTDVSNLGAVVDPEERLPSTIPPSALAEIENVTLLDVWHLTQEVRRLAVQTASGVDAIAGRVDTIAGSVARVDGSLSLTNAAIQSLQEQQRQYQRDTDARIEKERVAKHRIAGEVTVLKDHDVATSARVEQLEARVTALEARVLRVEIRHEES